MPTASDLLVMQDDSGLTPSATTYASIEYFTTYCIINGYSLIDPTVNGGATPFTDDKLAVALMAARRYMDTRWGSKYVGVRCQELQTTEWPRYDAYDNSEFYINGVTDAVRDAQCEYAVVALAGPLNPAPSRDETGQRVQRKTTQVGPILDSVTYAAGAAFTEPTYPDADNILKSKGYVTGGSTLIRS